MKTPVAIFFYRRPDHLRQVLAKIREARPKVLYGISDGPKEGKPEVLHGVKESRKVFREAIDWPCRWELLERPTNLGSYQSVSRGLDWVFERSEEAIILEDDTVPEPSFFRFASELLEKYRNVHQVGSINGSCYDDPADWTNDDSYRFTRYHHSWGWATWKRAWQYFTNDENLQKTLADKKWREKQGLSRAEWAYWDRCFRHTFAFRMDVWDYRWTLSLWAKGISCVVPRWNLVRNIGFDSLGTNTMEQEWAGDAMHDTRQMPFPLKHPARLDIDAAKDRQVFVRHFQKLEGRRNVWRKLRDRFSRVMERLL